MSLDEILSNPSLANTVSVEWIQAELSKQPYNRYLQGLLEQKTNENAALNFSNTADIIESIVSESVPYDESSYFIRDVILLDDDTFAEAEKNKQQEQSITSAAIGAGAIVTGSIVTGAMEAAEAGPSKTAEPLSNTDQIEESGLLGFLNRLEGSVTAKEPNPAVDPMLKKENYEVEPINGGEILDLRDEIDGNDVDSTPEQLPTLENEEESEHETMQEEPVEQLVFTDEVKSKKKKKKQGKRMKSPYRWSSETAEDYTMTNLDPFTTWINSIDGVEMVVVAEKKKKKRKKKKKTQYGESLEAKPEIASEGLAGLLVNQGHYTDAIAMYEQLSLINPEKSSFFAAKIETIKDKI